MRRCRRRSRTSSKASTSPPTAACGSMGCGSLLGLASTGGPGIAGPMPSGSNNGDVLVAVPSPYIPFREIAAGGIFGTGIDKGLVIMLRAYFDDSGTHPTSDAVLLGGLIGTCEQW